MTVHLPTTIAPYLLGWAALLILGTAVWVTAFEVAKTRRLRRDNRAIARAITRILRDAARNSGPDLRSWR